MNESKLSRLGLALEAYLEWRRGGSGESEALFLARHEDLRDLLEPMLQEDGDEDIGAAGEEPAPDALEEPDPLLGQQLGDYRIIAPLGRGAMGVVYEAQQVSLGRRVALKVLPAVATVNPQAVARFYRESALVARLHHPGIVEVLGVGQHQGRHFYAMELVHGVSLAEVLDELRRQGPGSLAGSTLPRAAWSLASQRAPSSSATATAATSSAAEVQRGYIGSALRLVAAVAEALHHAHEAGVLHRDIKPSNILLRTDGSPVVTDFGLAREEGVPSMTLTGEFAGTPYYVSPEQALGRTGELDRRTDIFSLGVMLYEVLTLRRPFEADSSHEVLQRILTREPLDPRRWNRAISPDLSAVVLRCLEKEPRRRYQTAAELAEDLRSCLELRPVSARRASAIERLGRWTRREPLKAAVVALIALGTPLVGGLGGYVLAKQQEIRTGEELIRDRQVSRLLQQAFVFVESDQRQRALALLDSALAMAPHEPIVLAGKAIVLCRQEPGAALGLLDRLPAEVGASRAMQRVRAYVLSRLGQEEAAAGLRESLGPPEGPVECLAAGMEQIEKGHQTGDRGCYEAARELLLQAALESQQAQLLIHQQLAHAVGHLDDAPYARVIARSLQANWPDSPPAFFWSAFALGEREPEESERALARAVALAPQSHFYAYNLGTTLLRRGRPAAALPHLEKAARIRPRDGQTLNNLGACYDLLGRHEDAVSVLRRAADAHPGTPMYRVNLGNALAAAGRYDEAFAEYRRALDLHPDYVPGWYEYADRLYRQRRLEEFSAIVGEAMQKTSDDPLIFCLRGRLALLRRDAEGARQAFESALAMEPDHAEAHLWLSRALQHCGQPEAARQHAERAAEIEPSYAHFAELGRLLEQQGDREAALRAWQAAERHDPGRARAVLAQARVLAGMGRPREEVEAVLRRALAIEPGHHGALLSLGLSRRSAGDATGARDFLEMAVCAEPADETTHNHLLAVLAELQDRAVEKAEELRFRAEQAFAAGDVEQALLLAKQALAGLPPGPEHDRLRQGLLDAQDRYRAGGER